MSIEQVRKLLSRVSFEMFMTEFVLFAEFDKKHTVTGFPLHDKYKFGRIYLQCKFKAPCSKTGQILEWKSGKHYLSSHMTEDEVIKKAFVCIRDAITHEVMENFKVDNITLFNPHTSFEALLKVSKEEVKRD